MPAEYTRKQHIQQTLVAAPLAVYRTCQLTGARYEYGPSERLYVCAVTGSVQRARAYALPTPPLDAALGQLEAKPLSLDFGACINCCIGHDVERHREGR